ncbi:MAG: LysR family transcriptional regulator [Verrucomicrobiales bacterium]|nr:LysR family transcriptional regulator [Verrucomicrobiales bacterium]
MQIETFRILFDLVETASFSEAAERNGVTQSAVSQQIKAIEEKFGVTLVERGRKNFAVTPEGEIFLSAGKEILQIYEGIHGKLDELRNSVTGHLKIATVYSIGFHELPPYINEFKAAFPSVELEVSYRRSNQVYSDVIENRADLGLVAYPKTRKGIEIEPAWSDRLVVICPPGHRLAERKSLSLKNLDGQRFISFEPDLPTRQAIDAMFLEAGISVKEVVEFDNIETVKRGVEIENAISIVPSESVKYEVEAGVLKQVKLEGRNIRRPLGILRRRNKALTPAMREMIDILRAKMGESG